MGSSQSKGATKRIVRRRKLRPLRLALQIVSLIALVLLVPIGISALPAGICTIPLGEFWRIDCVFGFLQRFISSPLNAALWALVLFVAIPVLGSLLFGRVFCGLMCPIGTILDLLAKVKRVKYLEKLKLNNKYNKYAVIASFAAASAVVGSPTFCIICPIRGICTAFGSVKPVELALATVPMVLELSDKRAWCRYFCPVGGAIGIAGFRKIMGLKITPEKCVKCKACMRVCPTGAITEESLMTGEISRTECIVCLRCYDVCMYGALNFGKLPLLQPTGRGETRGRHRSPSAQSELQGGFVTQVGPV